jgi:uncharacterized protein (DUF2235 family)
MAKNIVVCLDGTWNQPEKLNGHRAPTNVLKFMRALLPTGPRGRCQVVFYDPGVGTTGSVIDRITGGVFGVGLSQNVLDGYGFIANNYDAGEDDGAPDDIFLFGFSRGAFTARSLAGMLGAVGLLEKRQMNRLPEAFDIYRTKPDDRERHRSYGLVNETRKVTIKCIGVWDTVGALGIPVTWLKWLGCRRYCFHNVELGSNVRYAYHALAIDEHRKPFAATIWKRPSDQPKHQQVVEQVWFAGSHSNIGGGYRNSGLSDIALQWMIEKAEACGLSFDQEYVRQCVVPRVDDVLVDSRTLFYKAWPRAERQVRHPDHFHESVHPSVLERICCLNGDYAPQNRHLEQIFAEMSEGPGEFDWAA